MRKLKNILFYALAAVLVILTAGCQAPKPANPGGGGDEKPTFANDEMIAEEEEEEMYVEPRFPDYIRPKEELRDPEGFRGDEWIVVGKNGCLYENGYINEYLGYAQKYIDVTDRELYYRVDVLKDIQVELEARGVAFCVVITPSKAAAMPAYIPDWYKGQNKTLTDNYVRPYVRFVKMLEEAGVYFVDSSSLYKSIGLTNTFPKTGIHWNRLAAYETSISVIAEYERQTGKETKHIKSDGVLFGKNPQASEQDIFGIIYGSHKNELPNAIIDERYFWPDAYVSNTSKPSIKHMLIQGGSFTGDFWHYFGGFGIASDISAYYYNNGGDVNLNWAHEIGRTSFVLLEVNEQFVYNMGGVSPAWGYNDIAILDFGPNIIDSLWDYLKN